ncbi:AEC family transporter [Novosphingobium sp. P6W]|uniref:AEC family transporter n=1 Tax=Novosphingobium sp. P6W TaxID=1609758 RepID=UPI0005C2E385|nr:AEC family transporter [Novosphingobium sp. P6W]AXB76527.1 AEC family transporter [Novosphingobium sp. P6W]KIS30774.1 transporter [Novosphingobium sp. P6W]
MTSILAIVLPIFALIFAGWLVRRIGVMGPQASSELNRFVVYLALPALLFDIVSGSSWKELWQPHFVAVFTISTMVVFVATILLHARKSGLNADGPVLGLATAYPNTGYLGFPLLLAALGPSSNTLTLISTIIVACVLFAGAIVMIEVRLHVGSHPLRVAAKVAKSLAKNPLIVAPVVAAFFPASGLAVPHPVEVFLKLLGAAASPCALVGLGLFLAQKRPKVERSDARLTSLLVAIKLVVHPALAWLLATTLFPLSAPARHAAVLLAMLPTGTGPFMLAEFYGREAGVTARVILVSTVLSIATISVYLAAIG